MTSWQIFQKQNQEMVDKFMRLAIITSKEVENAFRCVNRAAFVSEELLDEAFVDAPIKGAPFIHMSAPHMYASLLEDLELEAGMSFLNIGSGTGYFSCLTGYLLRKHGINHGVEIHGDLVNFAKERVEDFLSNGHPETKEICLPTFIVGNCFQLDSTQMKYDRLYCGGACSQSIVTFFLQFLKIGGFLIAPVGTKLVKLERVSHKEGVKTVLSDVCFAPLTKLDAIEATKLRHGLLPLLRFPVKTKNRKSQRTIFIKAKFPVSKSPTKKKLSRLRAIQDALDYMELSSNIPLPFCYVPQIDQINAYKQYNKCTDRQRSTSKTENHSTSPPLLTSSLVNQSALVPESPRQLMTIQEFLLAASPPTVFQEFYSNQNRSSTRYENRENSFEQETFVGPRLLSFQSNTANRLQNNNNNIVRPAPIANSVITPADQILISNPIDIKVTSSTPTCLNSEFDIGKDICKDIWEHLCTDKLWEMVVDYYYSVAATTSDRKGQCFDLKGIELINPAAAKLVDVLFYKLKSKKLRNFVEEQKLFKFDSQTPTSTNGKYELPPERNNTSTKTDIPIEVEICMNDLVDVVCHNVEIAREESLQDVSAESVDSILSLPSVSTGEMSECLSLNTSSNSLPTSNNIVYNKKTNRTSRLIDIKTDNETTEQLYHLNCDNWSIDHDIELISYLVNQGKEQEKFTLRDNLPKIIKADIFDKMKLTKYPQLSTFHPHQLAYRSIVLIRLAKIIDSVLDILVGPSIQRNQFDNPFEEKYPLSSFNEKSFEVSDTQLNVVEAQLNIEQRTGEEVDEGLSASYQEARCEKDEELLDEVNTMINYELNNVNQQQSILMRKLELIDNIDEQFKEQIKLLTQQVELIDEQQRLLTEVHIEAAGCEHIQMRQTQQNVSDRKLQRQFLIAKRERINNDRNVQLAERKELLSMLEQLLSLETRLKNELKALERKGMGYLRGDESDLSNFSQFVNKAEQILGKLKHTSKKMINGQPTDGSRGKSNGKQTSAVDMETNRTSLRYQPQTILPRCRFLLPLSKKRFSFIREMLRTTERSAPKHMPIISIDRRIPLKERKNHGEFSTVFMQIYHGIKNKDLHYRWNKKSYEQWWEVKFSGEGIIDQGGGFRDSLTEVSEELCPYALEEESCLPLFIKTPNQLSGMGDYLDCYTFNPNCKDLHLYKWLGQLMGACFRTDERLPLPLPPYLWKLLVGEHVSWKKDFIHIDEATVRNIDGLENLDEDAYNGLHLEQSYYTTLSDQNDIDLIPDGCEIVVKCNERSKYSAMVRKARMFENIKQVQALRSGLVSVIPEAVLSCLTWKNLEKGICGDPLISIADLKANCRYADDLKVTSQCIIHMWAALTSFTNDERSRFIRFITGRKRLPSPFVVSRSSVDRDNLPSASTCGSNLFLPEYSCLQVAKEKIRYAIFNCIAIDTDTSPW